MTHELAFLDHRSSAWVNKFWHLWCLVRWYFLERLPERHKWRVSTNKLVVSCDRRFVSVVIFIILVVLSQYLLVLSEENRDYSVTFMFFFHFYSIPPVFVIVIDIRVKKLK